jgi:hypothetical protein
VTYIQTACRQICSSERARHIAGAGNVEITSVYFIAQAISNKLSITKALAKVTTFRLIQNILQFRDCQ